MSTSLFAFNWPVHYGGYRFDDIGGQPGGGHQTRVLAERDEPDLASYRRYDPLHEAPALFRELAATEPEESAIIAFADKWGLLGVPEVIAGRRCETFAAWVRVISEMRAALWIWDRLIAGMVEKRRELRSRVVWERDGQGRAQIVFDTHPHLPRTESKTDDGYDRVLRTLATESFSENELSQPARTVLCDLVNFNLARQVSPQLLAESWPVKVGPGLPVFASLQLAPTTLAACLWLQLAQVVSGARAQRQCTACGEWFEVQGKRSDKQYCTEACRKRLYQSKRDHACRLRAEGKTVKAIAKELGADEEHVKEWVAKQIGSGNRSPRRRG